MHLPVSLQHFTSGEFKVVIPRVLIPNSRMFNALRKLMNETILTAFDDGFGLHFNANARYLAKRSIWHLHSIANGDGKVKRRRG